MPNSEISSNDARSIITRGRGRLPGARIGRFHSQRPPDDSLAGSLASSMHEDHSETRAKPKGGR